MQSAGDAHGMSWAIKEIGITKGDVACSLSYLGTNICQHNLRWYSKETTSVDRSDGAMQARMFTAAGGFGIASQPRSAIGLQVGVAFRRGQMLACWNDVWSALYPGVAIELVGSDPWYNPNFAFF